MYFFLMRIAAKSSHLLNDLSNCNGVFRKDVAYDNIKSHKKAGFHSLSRKHIFGKTQERDLSLQALLLKIPILVISIAVLILF